MKFRELTLVNYRLTSLIPSAVIRSPATAVLGLTASMRSKSSFVSRTSAAAAFSSRYLIRFVPGIGSAPLAIVQAIANWDGVQSFSWAISLILSTISTFFWKFSPWKRSIRGVNATSLAGVLGEAGDLSGYTHGNALLRHAGLNLAEASSGKWRGKMVLSKRGRPRLRRFLYLMTMCMVMTNPDIRALHHHNVDVKSSKK